MIPVGVAPITAAPITAALVDLGGKGHYLHWGFIQLSVANALVIAAMIVVFLVALVLPFRTNARHRVEDGGGEDDRAAGDGGAANSAGAGAVAGAAGAGAAGSVDRRLAKSWTARVRRRALRALPPERLLPDKQPAYLTSWVYVFGVMTLAALVVVLVTGIVLVLEGPNWWHVSSKGLFVNSMHLWSVELFFFFMVLHLWGKFFMAAWRGKRGLTWMTGVVSFVASIGAAFTGYLSQENFDSQWIAAQSKDAMNAAGIGGWFTVTNFGQMLAWHIAILPVTVVVIVGLHLVMVRSRGIAPPMEVRVRVATAAAGGAAAGMPPEGPALVHSAVPLGGVAATPGAGADPDVAPEGGAPVGSAPEGGAPAGVAPVGGAPEGGVREGGAPAASPGPGAQSGPATQSASSALFNTDLPPDLARLAAEIEPERAPAAGAATPKPASEAVPGAAPVPAPATATPEPAPEPRPEPAPAAVPGPQPAPAAVPGPQPAPAAEGPTPSTIRTFAQPGAPASHVAPGSTAPHESADKPAPHESADKPAPHESADEPAPHDLLGVPAADAHAGDAGDAGAAGEEAERP